MMPANVLEMVVAHPDPLGLRVVQLLSLVASVNIVRAEIQGQGARYSKFASVGGPLKGRTVSSKRGMAFLYSPAALFCSTFLLAKLCLPPLPPSSHPVLAFFAPTDLRLIVFATALAFHFVKRLLEVFFVHKYSGSMEASMSSAIAVFYLISSLNLLYAQQLSVQLHPPALDLMGWGVVIFLGGITGNFYHHYLLASLRSNKKANDNKGQYVIPQGGLFDCVVCPHYLFESIGFLGLALIGQTTSAFVNALCVFITLGARSYSTKLWYQKKIEGFPLQRKAFVPLVF